MDEHIPFFEYLTPMLATQSAAATQTTVAADDTDKGGAAPLTYRDVLTVANFLPRK